jgi:serine/threonine protein kinase
MKPKQYKLSKTKKHKNYKIYKKSKSQYGGTVLGKGGFGCVVAPYIPCDSVQDTNNTTNKTQKKYKKVSKILFKEIPKDDINILENELQIAKLLSAIDPNRKYFCPHDNICRLDKEQSQDRDDITSVKFRRTINNRGSRSIDYNEFRKTVSKMYRKQPKNETEKTCRIDFSLKPINIIMPNCGIELTKILKYALDRSTKFTKNTTNTIGTTKQITKDKLNDIGGLNRIDANTTYGKTQKNNQYNLTNESRLSHIYIKIGDIIKNNFRLFVKKLLVGIKLMHENYIIHHDIKPGNILINIENKELFARIIDYNLSEHYPPEIQIKPINELFNLVGRSSGTQWFIPPEVFGIEYARTIYNRYRYIRTDYNHNHIAAYIIKKITNYYIYYCAKHGLDLGLFNYNNANKHLIEEEVYYISKLVYSQILNGNDDTIYNFIKKKYFGVSVDKNTTITDGWWYKFDIFSLGLTIYKTAHDIGIDVKNNLLLVDLLRNMLYMNPDKRFNILQCLSHPFITTK